MRHNAHTISKSFYHSFSILLDMKIFKIIVIWTLLYFKICKYNAGMITVLLIPHPILDFYVEIYTHTLVLVWMYDSFEPLQGK